MKKTIALMEKLQEHLDEVIQKREEKFENASDKWQDSDRGEAFNETTERLQEMMDELIDWQNELGSEL